MSYDLVGLVYYLIYQNNFVVNKKMFLKKNMFKGKIGIFEIKNNKINHILNFYKVEEIILKKFFNFFKSNKAMINFIFSLDFISPKVSLFF